MSLVFENVCLHRQGKPMFQPLNFVISPGEIVAIMGPSGIGKSSILQFMIGFLSPFFESTGRIVLNGRDLSNCQPHDRGVGILFQDDFLFPHLNVLENLIFGIRGQSRTTKIEQAQKALEPAGLLNRIHSSVQELSGGEKARVSLLRTLLAKPETIALDEPFGKLDIHLRNSFRQWVYQKVREQSIPVILVTHDPQDVPDSGRIITLGEHNV